MVSLVDKTIGFVLTALHKQRYSAAIRMNLRLKNSSIDENILSLAVLTRIIKCYFFNLIIYFRDLACLRIFLIA